MAKMMKMFTLKEGVRLTLFPTLHETILANNELDEGADYELLPRSQGIRMDLCAYGCLFGDCTDVLKGVPVTPKVRFDEVRAFTNRLP